MIKNSRIRVFSRRRHLPVGCRLELESLEERCVPTAATWPGLLHPLAARETNGTLDQAQNLSTDLNTDGQAGAVGTIGVAGAAQVDWFQFTLTKTASVGVTTLDRLGGSSFQSVVSLYAADPNDPYTSLGYRLLAQDDGGAGNGDALVQRQLAAGTYYVAVSGSGDRAFNPFLPNSGFGGDTGSYGLLVTATALPAVPAVLAVDPAPGAALAGSPFLVRLDLPSAPAPTEAVQLTDENGQVLPSQGTNYIPDSNQLQWVPAAPLPAGTYTVSVTDGARTLYTSVFLVTGNEGNTAAGAGADDAVPSPGNPTTPHELGDITGAGLIQASGAIGDDATDPIPFDPSDVDLYHFQISGPGNYAVSLELFTQRIGSTLQGGLSLFQVAPDGQLNLLDSYDEGQSLIETQLPSRNQTIASDPALFDGLTAGDYYVAVSGIFNVPDPPYLAAPNPPGSNGVFDPAVSHSGQNGFLTGPYVLGILAQAETAAPQVSATTPSEGAVLTQPPSQLTVHFDKPINFTRPAYEAYRDNFSIEIGAVSLVNTDTQQSYNLVFSGYDNGTNEATFQLLDGLPNGNYELHVSGPNGLTDRGGAPLAGNDPSGDYVVHFTVNAPPRGTNGNPQLWTAAPFGSPQPQDLGPLFFNELLDAHGGVTIVRNPALPMSGTTTYASDEFRFELPNFPPYTFALTGTSLPPGATFTLMDGSGNVIPKPPGTNPNVLNATNLNPGVYLLSVTWPATPTTPIGYRLQILSHGSENAVPLTTGPTPALQIRLATAPAPGSNGTVSAIGPVAPTRNGVGPITLGPAGSLLNSSGPALPVFGPATGSISASTPTGSPSFSIATTLAAIPPDLTRVLSSGPLGNPGDVDANGTAAKLDRVLVQLPDANVLQGLLQLTILTQPAGGTESFTASSSSLADLMGSGDPLASVADSLGRLTRVWGEVLDRLFSTRSDSDVHPSPQDDEDLPQESDVIEEADVTERLALLGRRPRTDVAALLVAGDSGPSAADRAWAGVLASLVVCPLAATLAQGTPSRPRKPALRNREERN